MFNLQIIIDAVSSAVAPFVHSGKGDSHKISAAAGVVDAILSGIEFEKDHLSAYFSQMPEMWGRVTTTNDIETELRLAFDESLRARIFDAALSVVGCTSGSADTLMQEIDALVEQLAQITPYFQQSSNLSGYELTRPSNPLIAALGRFEGLTRRLCDADRDVHDFRLLMNAIDTLLGALYTRSSASGDKLGVSGYIRSLVAYRRHAELIHHGMRPMTSIKYPSRFESFRGQKLRPSERSISVSNGKNFLEGFEAKYGMEPLEFVTVRESLKTHYRLMNPATMQIMFDHFGLTPQAWEDGFDIVSRDAKSSLRAQKLLKFDVISKSSLDPLVKKTFGKSQGLHNHRHDPDFTGPTRKWKRR